MQQVVSELLAKRRDRAIAIILGVKEREVDQYLPPDAKARLRKAILDQLNEYHDLFVDIVRSMDTDSPLNEIWLEKLDAIYSVVVARK